MRHNKKFNHLGRTASHRASMLANMAISLIMHKRITTTVAKAKALKKYVEPLTSRTRRSSRNSSLLSVRRLATVPVDTPVLSSWVPVRVTLLRFALSSSWTSIPKWQRLRPRRRLLVVLASLPRPRLLLRRLLRLRKHLLLRLLRKRLLRLPLLKRQQRLNKFRSEQRIISIMERLHHHRCRRFFYQSFVVSITFLYLLCFFFVFLVF